MKTFGKKNAARKNSTDQLREETITNVGFSRKMLQQNPKKKQGFIYKTIREQQHRSIEVQFDKEHNRSIKKKQLQIIRFFTATAASMKAGFQSQSNKPKYK